MYTSEFENKQTMTITLRTLRQPCFFSSLEAAVSAVFNTSEWFHLPAIVEVIVSHFAASKQF